MPAALSACVEGEPSRVPETAPVQGQLLVWSLLSYCSRWSASLLPQRNAEGGWRLEAASPSWLTLKFLTFWEVGNTKGPFDSLKEGSGGGGPQSTAGSFTSGQLSRRFQGSLPLFPSSETCESFRKTAPAQFLQCCRPKASCTLDNCTTDGTARLHEVLHRSSER